MAEPKPLSSNRFILANALLFITIGTLLLLLSDRITYYYNIKGSLIFLIGGTFTLTGIGLVLILYLRGDLFTSDRLSKDLYDAIVRKSTMSSFPDEIQHLYKEIENLKNNVIKVGDDPRYLKELSPEEKALLRTELKNQLETVIASDLVKQIEDKYATKIADDAQVVQIRKGLEITSLRLRQEIAALSRRSNLNLVIGVLTTAVAVGLLAYLVWGSTVSFTNIPDLLAHFIPRISVAAFIEVFSFFFLKLYKSNLQEIKYFQNELTNIEMKGIALEAALLNLQNKVTEPVIDQLIKTDRNLLGASSPTVSNKDAKPIEPKDIAELLDKLGKLLSLGTQK